ncbi:MAG: response regulator [Candidatus Doudnabacteria bacterium]|nr:response regulator [Candidatus Doudnabacteria bacterium]
MAGKEKILVVEDEEILLAALREELAQGGYETEGAADGEEGLSKAKSFKPDLILLDLVMPKMDGMQVLKKLKEDPATSNLAVVILTNLSDYERISEALSLGAKDYLVKANYSLSDLLDKVKTVLSRKKIANAGNVNAGQ